MYYPTPCNPRTSTSTPTNLGARLDSPGVLGPDLRLQIFLLPYLDPGEDEWLAWYRLKKEFRFCPVNGPHPHPHPPRPRPPSITNRDETRDFGSQSIHRVGLDVTDLGCKRVEDEWGVEAPRWAPLGWRRLVA